MFLAPGADASIISSIRELLDVSPEVAAFEHRNEDAAWAEFQAMFADRPDMLSAVGREDIPSAFLVITVDGGVDGLRSELHEVAGVRGVLAAAERANGDCVPVAGEGDGG